MATFEVTLPPRTNFLQDDLPSPATHHMSCFGCAFSSRPALQYQVLVDEEGQCSNIISSEKDHDKCIPIPSPTGRWKALVNSASMKKRHTATNATKPDFTYDLRSYNLNFDQGEE